MKQNEFACDILLNALKHVAGIKDKMLLLSKNIIYMYNIFHAEFGL